MAKRPTKVQSDPFKGSEAKFSKALGQWSDLAAQTVTAQGLPDVGGVIIRLKDFLLGLVAKLFESLKETIAPLNPILGNISEIVSGTIDNMLDGLIKLLEDLADAPGAVTDAAIGAVLGLVEAIKKTLHLLLDGIKLPELTAPVELLLDLIDNVLGNIAELVSPKAGHTAKIFRNNMYGQLAAIRAADAARGGRFSAEERRDEE